MPDICSLGNTLECRIEINPNGCYFERIGNYHSVQRNTSEKVVLSIFVKEHKIINESIILAVKNVQDKSTYFTGNISRDENEVTIIFHNGGVYCVSCQLHDKRKEFFFHIQNMPKVGNVFLRLEQLCVQTVVPKWLGTMDRWESRLSEEVESKFNAIHLLPFQTTGSSNSPYSIRNHLEISPEFLPASESSSISCYNYMKKTLQGIKDKLLLITDVVWNHTSCDSDWLREHSESGYNLVNSPHLKIAYKLECCLMELSSKIQPFHVTVESLDTLRWLIRQEAVSQGIDIYIRDVHHFMNHHFWSIRESLLDRAIENILSLVYYERIDANGPKKGPITKDCPIVPNYFTVMDRNDDNLIFANNGWVYNNDDASRFVEPSSMAYFLREVNVWSDCVKLRYGECRDDNPWLWDYMAEYSKTLANIFDGFRIDNCHSCQIAPAQYCLKKAKEVNPNLIVIGELFTGSVSKDIEFASKLGIDLLIRENLYSASSNEICSNSYRHSYSMPIGSFQKKNVDTPRSILMDCTHDNLTPTEMNKFIYTIPNMAIACFHNCAIGSTRGYDNLNNKKYEITMKFSYPEEKGILLPLRRYLNNLHSNLLQGYDGFCCEITCEGIVKITRENSNDHSLFILYANCSLSDQERKPLKLDCVQYGYRIESNTLCYLSEGKLIMKEKCTLSFLYPGQIYIIHCAPIFEIPIIDSLELDLVAANHLLYRHSKEEMSTSGRESYLVPDYGKLFYCGIQSIFDVLEEAFCQNNMEHPICKNIRNGDWLIDYICDRTIENNKINSEIIGGLKKIKLLPTVLKPLHLYRFICKMYHSVVDHCLSQMGLSSECKFAQKLAMTSVQLIGILPRFDLTADIHNKQVASMSAGLPHFCVDIWRCWGRDTFISFRGLFLHTKRFEEAKMHIFAFASCLKNGLIPNLLDSGRYPRFNSRDTPWLMLQAIQDYCEFTKDHNILNAMVPLRFGPDCETYSKHEMKDNVQNRSLVSIVHEIICRHWNGIELTEDYPFGDSNMRGEGRKISIFTDKNSGFVYGGNEYNCGTWMDKMGKGSLPVTPRCGANIEIVALIFSSLKWLESLYNSNYIETKYIWIDTNVTVSTWSELIFKNFENNFFDSKRGIYLDTLDSNKELRPNFPLAMSIVNTFFIYF